jgi:hypothetical protein
MKQIEKHQNQVAKDRDALDDYIAELRDLKEDCENAWDALQDARDALSELV